VFVKVWKRLGLYSLLWKNVDGHPEHLTSSGKKSSRSSRNSEQKLQEEQFVGPDVSSLEYAVERKILETASLDLSYYADVVGYVPSSQDQAKSVQMEPIDIGNGDLSPEWGVDIVVRGGYLRYGPWADRQR
jgi:hypothetical protein